MAEREAVPLHFVAGSDGCPGGWVLVRGTTDGRSLTAEVLPDAAALLARASDALLLAVDIPIGLAERAPRPTDAAARAALGARRSSVFPAPLRGVLDATDQAEASARSRRLCGKGMSIQAFNIMAKVRDMDAVLRRDPESAARTHEVHPEVSFACWQGAPMAHPKKGAAGRAERLALVERWIPGAFSAARAMVRRAAAADDDLLDAIAALWSAQRIAEGRAASFPPGPPARDAHGLPMVIRA